MTRTLLGLLMAGLMAAPLAHADDSIWRANNSVQIYAGVHDVDYMETDHTAGVPNGELDSEKGAQAATGVAMRFQGNPGGILAPLYAEASAQRANGTTKYKGYLQSMSSSELTPYQFNDVKAVTYDISAKLGYALSVDNGRQQVTPYIAAGTHRWTRDSSASEYGYREDYRHHYVAAGVKWQMVMSPTFIGEVDASLGRTGSARMTVTADQTAFPLQAKMMAGLQGTLVQRLTDRFDVRYGVNVQHFEYGQSPVIGGYLEPDSRTTNVTASVGLGLRF